MTDASPLPPYQRKVAYVFNVLNRRRDYTSYELGRMLEESYILKTWYADEREAERLLKTVLSQVTREHEEYGQTRQQEKEIKEDVTDVTTTGDSPIAVPDDPTIYDTRIG